MRGAPRRGLFACLLLGACAGPPPVAPAAAGAQDVVAPTATEPPPASSATVAPPVAPATAPADPAPAAEPVALLAFERVLEVPVRSLAFGEGNRVAALGDEPWLFEAGKWHPIPLPASMKLPPSPESDARIYFGRDHRPRIMGWQRQGEGKTQVYLRFLAGAWKRERGEIGRLIGAPAAPLYGVLGYDDPEVVCKPGDVCLIKQRSGWTEFPAPAADLPTVTMSGGAVWALDERRLRRLGEKGWLEVASPIPWRSRPTDLWSDGKVLWIAEAGGLLHRWDGSRWTTGPSPLAGPRGLWGSSESDLWLAADGGAAHHDDSGWRQIAGPRGPLALAAGRPGEVWLGGPSGLWRGRR